MALTLSSVIVALVSSVFLTQNNFYCFVVQRTRVQDNLRVVTDLIASEVRRVAGGGVTTAEGRRFVVRLPIAMAGVCRAEAAAGHVYMPGLSQIYGNEVAGYARQDGGGNWTYTADTWSNLLDSSGSGDADACLTTSGADTVGAVRFHNAEVLQNSEGVYVPVPYDFDWTGFVSARYARPDERLGIRSVRQRIYRGFCRPDFDFSTVYAQFVEIRADLEALYTGQEGLEAGNGRDAVEYLDDFYEDIESPRRARDRLERDCRSI